MKAITYKHPEDGYSPSLSSNTSNASVQQYPLNELRQANVHSITPENKSINLILKTTIICSIFTPIEHNWGSTDHILLNNNISNNHKSIILLHCLLLMCTKMPNVVPSVDTVRGFPARGGIVPKRGRKRRHTATVHNMTPETAERNRCRICKNNLNVHHHYKLIIILILEKNFQVSLDGWKIVFC